MKQNSYLTYKDILADVLPSVGDLEYKNGLTPGFYKRQIQTAIDEFDMDVYLPDDKYCDKTLDANLRVSLPVGVYDIIGVWVYSGVIKDPSAMIPVTYKFGMSRDKGSDAEFGRRAANIDSNEFFASDIALPNVYYCARQEDDIIFSSTCSSYEYTRIRYHGFSSAIDEVPLVPRAIRRAVIGMVRQEALKSLAGINKDQQRHYSNLMMINKMDDDEALKQAKFRIGKMSKFERNSMNEYFRGIATIYG